MLCVARPRLDVCARLANREIAKNKRCFRYLAFDASPQHRGRELFLFSPWSTLSIAVPLNRTTSGQGLSWFGGFQSTHWARQVLIG